MSEFDVECHACGETFSSYINTTCDDCECAHEDEISKQLTDLKAQLKTKDEAIRLALMNLNYLYKHKFDLQEFGPSYIYNTIQSINTLLGREG